MVHNLLISQSLNLSTSHLYSNGQVNSHSLVRLNNLTIPPYVQIPTHLRSDAYNSVS
jgi:hypothetical protein